MKDLSGEKAGISMNTRARVFNLPHTKNTYWLHVVRRNSYKNRIHKYVEMEG